MPGSDAAALPSPAPVPTASAAPHRRVLVTGVGALTPLGDTAAATWEAALAGRPGASSITAEWASRWDMPVTFAAQTTTPGTDVLPRHEARRLDPAGQYAVAAARQAWADAGSPEVDPLRLAAVVATGMGGLWTLFTAYDVLRDRGARRVPPMTVPMLMPNGPAGAVSLALGAAAGAHSPVSACASGAEAVSYGLQMIRAGRADIVVAGGTEATIHPMPLASFHAMQALSTRNESPETASRPYDTARDGFVLGDGSGILVLESEEHARARGARVYAEVLGAGLSADAHHIAAPEPEGMGASRAVQEALAVAGATPADVVHINAHATSTPVGDLAEVKALRRALGPDLDRAAVSATKSMTGHLLGAAGAVESIFTVLALHHRLAPPTINLDDLDPGVDLDVVRKDPRPLPAGGVALNNSFGFGGHNVAVAFGPAS
ncbi:beta-ketoacyl synthase [Quadrisphaera sp. DSM 44207]|uniref:beta-ketoacyl-[acyl-carrier-protein] synthase family protein n=1 Tax=Quadrisphaera sp. DSM 44207 TaxID=1881057 RepID=UPI00087E1674|nr:beta-ketoacyl-ACP synthase II [Quadrisphaera sp. DSM 44207]SDQ04277.1 3-oxoacyl-[acyl-carrier-protein] synthase II [Quadrisphaera sp. DSM 44207]